MAKLVKLDEYRGGSGDDDDEQMPLRATMAPNPFIKDVFREAYTSVRDEVMTGSEMAVNIRELLSNCMKTTSADVFGSTLLCINKSGICNASIENDFLPVVILAVHLAKTPGLWQPIDAFRILELVFGIVSLLVVPEENIGRDAAKSFMFDLLDTYQPYAVHYCCERVVRKKWPFDGSAGLTKHARSFLNAFTHLCHERTQYGAAIDATVGALVRIAGEEFEDVFSKHAEKSLEEEGEEDRHRHVADTNTAQDCNALFCLEAAFALSSRAFKGIRVLWDTIPDSTSNRESMRRIVTSAVTRLASMRIPDTREEQQQQNRRELIDGVPEAQNWDSMCIAAAAKHWGEVATVVSKSVSPATFCTAMVVAIEDARTKSDDAYALVNDLLADSLVLVCCSHNTIERDLGFIFYARGCGIEVVDTSAMKDPNGSMAHCGGDETTIYNVPYDTVRKITYERWRAAYTVSGTYRGLSTDVSEPPATVGGYREKASAHLADFVRRIASGETNKSIPTWVGLAIAQMLCTSRCCYTALFCDSDAAAATFAKLVLKISCEHVCISSIPHPSETCPMDPLSPMAAYGSKTIAEIVRSVAATIIKAAVSGKKVNNHFASAAVTMLLACSFGAETVCDPNRARAKETVRNMALIAASSSSSVNDPDWPFVTLAVNYFARCAKEAAEDAYEQQQSMTMKLKKMKKSDGKFAAEMTELIQDLYIILPCLIMSRTAWTAMPYSPAQSRWARGGIACSGGALIFAITRFEVLREEYVQMSSALALQGILFFTKAENVFESPCAIDYVKLLIVLLERYPYLRSTISPDVVINFLHAYAMRPAPHDVLTIRAALRAFALIDKPKTWQKDAFVSLVAIADSFDEASTARDLIPDIARGYSELKDTENSKLIGDAIVAIRLELASAAMSGASEQNWVAIAKATCAFYAGLDNSMVRDELEKFFLGNGGDVMFVANILAGVLVGYIKTKNATYHRMAISLVCILCRTSEIWRSIEPVHKFYAVLSSAYTSESHLLSTNESIKSALGSFSR